MEVFRKARIAIERWVDDARHRPLVLRGDYAAIMQHPGLIGVLEQFAAYGPVLETGLRQHLAVMVENRRKHYSARPD
jgi:hypothetical protein